MSVPKRSLTRLSLNTFANIVIGMVAQIAAGIAVARILGPANKGIITYAGYLLVFAVTLADGIRDAISYQIGKRGLPARDVWSAALRLIAVAGLVGSLVFIALAWFWPLERAAFVAAAIAFAFAVYLQSVNCLYQIFHRVERINLTNSLTVGAGAPLITLLLLLVWHVGVPIVLGVWVAAYVVAAVWNSFGLKAMLGAKISGTNLAPLVREQIGFGVKAALSSTLAFLALRVDVFIVAAIMSAASLGVYTLALAAGELMWVFSRSLLWASTGRIATDRHEDAVALAARVSRTSLALHFAVGAALFAAGPALIDLVYGGRFSGAGPVLRILLPGLVLYGADGALSYFIAVRAGRPGLLLGFQSITLAACGALTYAGVLRFGMVGAAWADTIAYVLAFALKAGFFVRLTGAAPLDILLARPSDIPSGLRTRLRQILRKT